MTTSTAATLPKLRELEASLDVLLATPAARSEDRERWTRTRETIREAIAAIPAPSQFPDLLTEDWLKANGFKWHQLDRQPDKHWLLWLGDSMGQFTSYEDIGIELAPNVPTNKTEWFCWLRGDSAGRYHRFIHLRHVETTAEVVKLIEAISGRTFDPANCMYGSLRTPEQAASIRAEHDRLDRRLNRTGYPRSEAEKDDTRGRALPEHLEHHIKTVEKGKS